MFFEGEISAPVDYTTKWKTAQGYRSFLSAVRGLASPLEVENDERSRDALMKALRHMAYSSEDEVFMAVQSAAKTLADNLRSERYYKTRNEHFAMPLELKLPQSDNDRRRDLPNFNVHPTNRFFSDYRREITRNRRDSIM
jgi:hypothetical protein